MPLSERLRDVFTTRRYTKYTFTFTVYLTIRMLCETRHVTIYVRFVATYRMSQNKRGPHCISDKYTLASPPSLSNFDIFRQFEL